MRARTVRLSLCLLTALAPACSGNVGEQMSQPTGSGSMSPPGGGGGGAPMTGGMPSVPVGGGSASACAPLPRRIYKLGPSEFAATVAAVVPKAVVATKPLEETITRAHGAFRNDATLRDLSTAHLQELVNAADQAANVAIGDLRALHPCLADQSMPDAACVKSFVKAFATKAWRRPATSTEVDAIAALHTAEASTAAGVKGGVAQVVRAVLTSAGFLFRTELGPESATGANIEMTAYEKASAISYLLTGGPPDAELWQTAEAGTLNEATVLKTQVQRLLARPAASPGLLNFFREHFEIEAINGTTKDATKFPTWTATLASDMSKEALLTFQEILGGDAKFRSLFAGGVSMVNPGLAAVYGITPPAPSGFARATLSKTERAGLLTQPWFLASHAKPEDADPISRGLFVQRRILCQSVPPVPPNLDVVPPEPKQNVSLRDRYAAHAADPFCASCHRSFDPAGFLFGHYDGIGRYRAAETLVNANGSKTQQPIDSRGALMIGGQVTNHLNAVEASKALAENPAAEACFMSFMSDYVAGTGTAPDDGCRARNAAARLRASDGNIVDAFAGFVLERGFFTRANVR